ncbi:hypothetical protein MNBD_GAMMA24-2170 [hydrothermal vent metagenome]|uniref:Uncharacterized protein n=1 Tax=hydrothermal vent metagenome TaxID=652676 RepID=A0A3B1BMV0_9ZZZZ
MRKLMQRLIHGTLWLIERLHSEKIIHHKRAEQAYTEMSQKNRRLPWDEVEKQLKQFQKNRE